MLAVKPGDYVTGLRRSCLYAFTLNGLSLEVPRCRLRTVWWQLLFDGDMPDEHPQISSETDDRGLLGGGSYPRWLISIHTWSQLRITRRWIERRFLTGRTAYMSSRRTRICVHPILLAQRTAYHPHNRFESHYAASGTIWNHALIMPAMMTNAGSWKAKQPAHMVSRSSSYAHNDSMSKRSMNG